MMTEETAKTLRRIVAKSRDAGRDAARAFTVKPTQRYLNIIAYKAMEDPSAEWDADDLQAIAGLLSSADNNEGD